MPRAFLIGKNRYNHHHGGSSKNLPSSSGDTKPKWSRNNIKKEPVFSNVKKVPSPAELAMMMVAPPPIFDPANPPPSPDCLSIDENAAVSGLMALTKDDSKNSDDNDVKVILNFTPPSTPSGVVGGGPHSPSETIHTCPDCGKGYSTASNLTRHRQTHRSVTDKKARKCPHCDKIYVSIPAYSMHVRTHTQGCQCTICGKCFSRPWLLQGHIRTHTGEKPFKCHICTKAFADKSNLRAHVQTHSMTKPFICSRCGKAFALKSYLYKHEESSCIRMQHRNQQQPQPSAQPEWNC